MFLNGWITLFRDYQRYFDCQNIILDGEGKKWNDYYRMVISMMRQQLRIMELL